MTIASIAECGREDVERAVRAGTVPVNGCSEGDITTPFSGFKLSGPCAKSPGPAGVQEVESPSWAPSAS